ncbi:MAG: tetratricopeptide repeat protein [Spirochaetales bacterium]
MRIITVVLLAVFASSTIASQESETQQPSWSLLERGKRALRAGESAEALSYFRQVEEADSENADAARHIGLLYERAGDSRQALRYYERALERGTFEVPGTEVEVRYARARIFREQEDFGSYEREMQQLFELDEEFTSDETAPQRENQLRVVRNESLARALVLYRLEPTVFAPPHADYGAYLVRAGRFEESTAHLVRSVLESMSYVIGQYRESEPDYEFGSLYRFMDNIEDRRPLQDFLAERRVWEALYYLATALYFDGYSTRGRELWQFVVDHPQSGAWAARAQTQLQADRPLPPRFP